MKIEDKITKKVICIKEYFLTAYWLGANGHECKVGELFLMTIDKNEFYKLNGELVGICSIWGIEEFFIPLSEWREQQINDILND